jgi:hypothetical protein
MGAKSTAQIVGGAYTWCGAVGRTESADLPSASADSVQGGHSVEVLVQPSKRAAPEAVEEAAGIPV